MTQDSSDLKALQASLGLSFRDVSLLEQSLVHRSYPNENPDFPIADNERLEFLGDAVLGFVVAELVYCRFPGFTEGGLTKLRSALVRQEALARVARHLNLGQYLRLGRGEEGSGGRHRPKTQARAVEALIGAVLLDQGYYTAKALVLQLLTPYLDQAVKDKVADPKSQLQEVVQSQMRMIPVYRVVNEAGPEHSKRFTIEVAAGEALLGRGDGRSKRSAEKEAARAALEALSSLDIRPRKG